MASITDVTIAATATAILTAATSRSLGGPLYLKNESGEIITLTIAGADTYALDPGEVMQVLPGQTVTGTAVGGAALLQVIQGIVPSDESASKGGGSVAAAGSVSASGSRALWSKGQGDFTAVYLGVDRLTLGTFPTPLGTPDDGDFCMVVVTDSTGLQRVYLPTLNAMTLTAQVLTVTGAAFVTGGSADLDYDVFVWGPPKSYDATINADQQQRLNPDWTRKFPEDLVEDTNITDATVYYPFDMYGYKFWLFEIDLDCDAGTVTVTFEAAAEDDGVATELTADYKDYTLGLFAVASVVSTAAPASAQWLVSIPFPAKWGRFKAVFATTANTGDATIRIRGMY